MLTGCKTMTEDGKQIQGTPFWMAPEVRARAREKQRMREREREREEGRKRERRER